MSKKHETISLEAFAAALPLKTIIDSKEREAFIRDLFIEIRTKTECGLWVDIEGFGSFHPLWYNIKKHKDNDEHERIAFEIKFEAQRREAKELATLREKERQREEKKAKKLKEEIQSKEKELNSEIKRIEQKTKEEKLTIEQKDKEAKALKIYEEKKELERLEAQSIQKEKERKLLEVKREQDEAELQKLRLDIEAKKQRELEHLHHETNQLKTHKERQESQRLEAVKVQKEQEEARLKKAEVEQEEQKKRERERLEQQVKVYEEKKLTMERLAIKTKEEKKGESCSSGSHNLLKSEGRNHKKRDKRILPFALVVIVVALVVFLIMENESSVKSKNTGHNDDKKIEKVLYKTFPKIEKKQKLTSEKFYKYTLVKGDNLYSLSKKIYGDSKFWPLIYVYNIKQIKDMDKVYPGDRLKLSHIPQGTTAQECLSKVYVKAYKAYKRVGKDNKAHWLLYWGSRHIDRDLIEKFSDDIDVEDREKVKEYLKRFNSL